jgi:antitoxin (DNA-binding transcriptional repressor) of toxin-antitoxin stability system
MSITVPIETAERDLRSLVERLRLGETITLVGSQGLPEALLVSLKSAPPETQSVSDREARWDDLAHKVSRAWKSDKSAVEMLVEMRR